MNGNSGAVYLNGAWGFHQVTVEFLARAAVVERLDSSWEDLLSRWVLALIWPWAPRLVDLSIRLLGCPYEVSADFLHIKVTKDREQREIIVPPMPNLRSYSLHHSHHNLHQKPVTITVPHPC